MNYFIDMWSCVFAGNFSFGSLQNFKSNTIVDFIENAVEHSRSGRYLFFLHRRPQRGPMRVQLLNPVSRFKTKDVQSLQHMCRYFAFFPCAFVSTSMSFLWVVTFCLCHLAKSVIYSSKVVDRKSGFKVKTFLHAFVLALDF